MTAAARITAEADSAVRRWPKLPTRTALIYPHPNGTAEVSLAGVDRHFADVFAAIREVEALGLTAEVAPFGATPLVTAESPGLRVV